MSTDPNRAIASAALTFFVAFTGYLAPDPTSAQAEGNNNGSTPSEQLDEGEQMGGLLTVRLEHSLQHEYIPPNPIEEVTVRGQKPLSAYRQGVDEAVVEVWEAYNDKNVNDRFNVTCRSEVRTGTRIPQQVCRPRFLDEATSQAASGVLQFDKSSSVGLQQIEVSRAHALKRQLGNEMRGLSMSDPEVRAQVEEYSEQLADFEEARMRRAP
jgi:hypothetical protein